jgi:hypothetical protein
MVAPYFSGLLAWQSDFGHPVGAVLATIVLDDFPKSGLWRDSQTPHATCGFCVRVFTGICAD